MLIIAEKIKKMVRTLLNKTDINKVSGASYAQAVYKENITLKIAHPQTIKSLKKNLIREKQLLIRIINIIEAETIYKLFIKALIKRIITKMRDE